MKETTMFAWSPRPDEIILTMALLAWVSTCFQLCTATDDQQSLVYKRLQYIARWITAKVNMDVMLVATL